MGPGLTNWAEYFYSPVHRLFLHPVLSMVNILHNWWKGTVELCSIYLWMLNYLLSELFLMKTSVLAYMIRRHKVSYCDVCHVLHPQTLLQRTSSKLFAKYWQNLAEPSVIKFACASLLILFKLGFGGKNGPYVDPTSSPIKKSQK